MKIPKSYKTANLILKKYKSYLQECKSYLKNVNLLFLNVNLIYLNMIYKYFHLIVCLLFKLLLQYYPQIP